MSEITVLINSILHETESFVIASAESNSIPLQYDTYQDGTLKILGNSKILENVKYNLRGDWKEHPVYGWQFAFNYIEEYVPEATDLIGLEKYLSSGLFKGIGFKMANAIVSHFKENTLDIIQHDIKRLLEVKGISNKKLNSIIESYDSARKYQPLIVLLSPYNISMNKIVKIVEKYGDNAEHILKTNPYLLCKEIDGFGFHTADSLALAIGLDTKAIDRVKEGIKYCLKFAAYSEGHTYLPENMLAQRLSKILNPVANTLATKKFFELHNRYPMSNQWKDIEEHKKLALSFAVLDKDVHFALNELIINEEIIVEYKTQARKDGGYFYKKEENDYFQMDFIEQETIIELENETIFEFKKENKIEYFLKTKNGLYINQKHFGVIQRDCSLYKLWKDEQLAIKNIYRLMSANAIKPIKGSIEDAIKSLEKKYNVSYAEQQRIAMLSTIKKNILVLTGGPGTGKTTVVKGLIGLYTHFFPSTRVALAAPTGRAAKRLSESTGYEALTIHRLLEYGYDGFQINQSNPLKCDLLIVDETSMLDIELFSQLLKAIPTGCKLVIVGDSNQLPSVGPGSVLRDLIDSNEITCIELNQIFRQQGTSLIIVNAAKINNMETDLECGRDFNINYVDLDVSEQEIAKIISKIYVEKIKQYGVSNVEILVPFRKKSLISVEGLNKIIAPLANPPSKDKKEFIKNNVEFRENDRVMQMSNDYEKNIYNGDIGVIMSIVEVGDIVTFEINFDGNIVTYLEDELDNLVLAYVTTIHKSQGSEYPSVIMPVLKAHSYFLTRSLFYTGVTRASKEVSLIANPSAIPITIRSNNIQKRKTKLSDKLIKQKSVM